MFFKLFKIVGSPELWSQSNFPQNDGPFTQHEGNSLAQQQTSTVCYRPDYGKLYFGPNLQHDSHASNTGPPFEIWYDKTSKGLLHVSYPLRGGQEQGNGHKSHVYVVETYLQTSLQIILKPNNHRGTVMARSNSYVEQQQHIIEK